jgi:hypothetical protein
MRASAKPLKAIVLLPYRDCQESRISPFSLAIEEVAIIQYPMKSPFPGMDPYLEPFWLDVHGKLATYVADALNEKLPNDLVASIEERVAIQSESRTSRTYGPDVRIYEPPAERRTIVEEHSVAVIEAPFRLVVEVDPIKERSVRIIELGTERLITVIEFLSPTNKAGPGLQAFMDKRDQMLDAGVNFVEVDLIRAGDWRRLLRPHQADTNAASVYRLTIRMPQDPGAVYLFPIHLKDRLPSQVLPLRKGDPEIKLDLQTHIDHAYVSGRYDRRIDYSKPCEPPLDPDDAAWVEELLKAAGKR